VIVTRGELSRVQDFAHTITSTHWCTFSRRFALCKLQLQNWILAHHFTLNFQHMSQHSFSLPNRNHPALCTHLEGTYPLLFSEFQPMNQIFWSSALITVHHHSKSQSTSTSTIQYTHSTIKTKPQLKHTLMPLSAHTCQGVTCPIWIPGLTVFSGRTPRTTTAADTEQPQSFGFHSLLYLLIWNS